MHEELIDAHCHLDFEAFDSDRAKALWRARKNNIRHIIVPGTERKYWLRVRKLCETDDYLHACYGLHPYWVAQHTSADVDALAAYIEKYSPVAVGECGLDFRKDQADKKSQLFFFEAQLELAQHFDLPVVIHAVNATETVLQSIRKHKDLKGMIHSYSGSTEQAKQLVDAGFYISIGGTVTYKDARKIKAVVTEIPLTSLLVETDAPDQSAENHKDIRNEPAFLIDTVTAIAELKQQPISAIATQTSKNTKTLFDI